MNIGDVIGGFGDEDGITLHRAEQLDENNEVIVIEVSLHEPEDEDFAWAIEQLAILEETE